MTETILSRGFLTPSGHEVLVEGCGVEDSPAGSFVVVTAASLGVADQGAA
jgi:hypothetical protein